MTIDDHVLMALPELYRSSKSHDYFGTKLFLIYMFDGVVQVCSLSLSPHCLALTHDCSLLSSFSSFSTPMTLLLRAPMVTPCTNMNFLP